MAIKLADTARPNNYVDAEHLGTYPVAYAEDVWFADGTRLSEKTFDGQSIQKEELPLASATEAGNIYQYTGTTGTYKNGFFYKCVSDGEPSPTYSWEEIKYVDKPVLYSDTVPNIRDYDMGAIVCYTGEDIPPFQKGHLYIKETRQMNMYDYIAPVIGTGYNVVYSFKEKRDVAVNDVTYTENIVDGYHYFVANGYIESIANDEYTRVGYNSTQTTITGKPEFERTASNANVVDWYDIGGGSGGSNIWNGTHDEWDELTSEQKKQYDYAYFTDDSNEGEEAIVGFYGISGDLLSETHQCDGEEVEYTYTVPEDGYYAVTYDMSATTQTTQYCVAKMRGGNGILYTYDTTVSAPYRILARKFLPYLKTGSTIAIAHGGSYGQATVKINRIIYN